MKGAKILVTGAAGFIGHALVQKLDGTGYKVIAGVRRSSDRPGSGIARAVRGEMLAETDWSTALDGVHAVVHLAARTHVMRETASDPLAAFRKINVQGTLSLADQADRAGVKRFVFISSVGVHGRQGLRPFTEAGLPAPEEPYAVSKLEAEQALVQLADTSGMEVVIIRPPLVYGPGAPGNFGRLAEIIRKGIPLPLGAVNNRRSLVALDNLVDFIVCCLEHSKAANEIFLVSDEQDVSTTELIKKIGRALGKSPLLLPVPVWLMEAGLKLAGKGATASRLFGTLQVDCTKARTLLGWRPVVTMEEQLEKIRHEQ